MVTVIQKESMKFNTIDWEEIYIASTCSYK